MDYFLVSLKSMVVKKKRMKRTRSKPKQLKQRQHLERKPRRLRLLWCRPRNVWRGLFLRVSIIDTSRSLVASFYYQGFSYSLLHTRVLQVWRLFCLSWILSHLCSQLRTIYSSVSGHRKASMGSLKGTTWGHTLALASESPFSLLFSVSLWGMFSTVYPLRV